MIFFLDRANDTLLIDIKKLYKPDAKYAKMTLSLSNELTDELALWLECKLLVNGANVKVIRNIVNGQLVS